MVLACICTGEVSCDFGQQESEQRWRFSSSPLPALWGSGAGTVSLDPLCLIVMPRVL